MPARRAVSRPAIINHSFPPFYACYLLKSIQSPDSTSVYIGSTPSPPRRIRQHNGEITAGARKTASKRPWVMQMIVHGFPSRLSALQFEWAWQHPHRSRHLRDGDKNIFGNRAARILSKNILIVRNMIALHPFNTWPLHVKLFTEEAVKFWEASANKSLSLPPGFTCTIELEGVDGKSGNSGSGRKGPIDVTDGPIVISTLPYLELYCSFPPSLLVHCLPCTSNTWLGPEVYNTKRWPLRAKPSEHPDVDPDDLYVSDEDNLELLMLPEKTPSRIKSISSKRSASSDSEHESTKSRVRKSNKGRNVGGEPTLDDQSKSKKSKGKQRAVLSAEENASDSGSSLFLSDSDDKNAQIKRPRGRPRKSPSPPPATRIPVTSPVPPSPKSRVGRPKANSILNHLPPGAPAPAITPKRGPGRPPKAKVQSINSVQVSLNPQAEKQTSLASPISLKTNVCLPSIPNEVEVASPPIKRGRPKKQQTQVLPTSPIHKQSAKTDTPGNDVPLRTPESTKKKGKIKAIPSPAFDTSSGETFDFSGISDIDSEVGMELFKSPKRPRGTPSKAPVVTPMRKITTVATTQMQSPDIANAGCWMDLIHKSPTKTLDKALEGLTLGGSKPSPSRSNRKGPGPNDEVIELSD
ncbi:hypothetical protein CVT24_004135 [Panaeolus cyanescens]|uniref:GIY-YIG domain-containing protein n=1 Tax=Panaeolus cyanescens TaxID=181874 RepID=A0A409Y5Z4_9AGAR|nr:hypothetical protein CVT24_004135 [Panaeolus cyanescens]